MANDKKQPKLKHLTMERYVPTGTDKADVEVVQDTLSSRLKHSLFGKKWSLFGRNKPSAS
jgi:hypothetical protein